MDCHQMRYMFSYQECFVANVAKALYSYLEKLNGGGEFDIRDVRIVDL